MARTLVLLVLALLVGCGGEAAPVEVTGTAPPTEPPVAAEPTPEPTPPEAPPTPPATMEPRLPGEPSVYAADAGGLVRHGNVLVRFGAGDLRVLGLGETGRCGLSMEEESTVLPAGAWSSLTITTTAAAPEDSELCAAFAGSFTNGHPSDPAAGGPPAPPTFEGSECWLRPQLVAEGMAACASFTPPADPTAADASYAVALYAGTCCVGAPSGTLTAPASATGFLLSRDGTALVAVTHQTMIAATEVAADPVIAQVITAAGTTPLHLAELLAGDPVLAEGSGFAIELHLDAREIVARVAGGDEHRRAL